MLAPRLWLALILTSGCAPQPSTPPDPHLLLVLVDTLRPDHLGCYGYERDTSPAIDALAARGVRFDQARSTAPWTVPSVASVLTGLHPTSHGANAFEQGIADEVPTLAEMLAGRGYRTGAVVSHFLVGEQLNFGQGFESLDEGEARGRGHVSTHGVTRRAKTHLRELAQDSAPFFLFVHYFDPHYDYQPHDEVDFAPASAGRLKGGEPINRLRQMPGGPTTDELEFLIALYDEEIRHTDAGIGDLFAELRELGLEEETLVVFASDHGEEFFTRGWLGHTRTLYDEIVRVPLIMAGPGVDEERVVSRPVSLVSIVPTVLELLGLEGAESEMEGPSLAELARGREGGATAPSPIFFEVDVDSVGTFVDKAGVADSRYKLIRDDWTGAIELYDLLADPGEGENLAVARPDVAARYVQLLDAHPRYVAARRAEASRAELTSEEQQMLKELGYIKEN